MKNSEPRPIGEAVESFLEKRDWNFLTHIRRAGDIWSRIASEGMRMNCRVVSCTNGTLEIDTDSAVWAQEIRMLIPELIRLFNQEAGESLVERITVRIRRKSG